MPAKKSKVRMTLSIIGVARRRLDALAFMGSTTLTGLVENLINERWYRDGGGDVLGHLLGEGPQKRPMEAGPETPLKKRRRRQKKERASRRPHISKAGVVVRAGASAAPKKEKAYATARPPVRSKALIRLRKRIRSRRPKG
jgi:hypothetical protein